jgi:hypothetical protein
MKVAASAREVGACTDTSTAHESRTREDRLCRFPQVILSYEEIFMRTVAIMLGSVCALLSSLVAVGSGPSAHAGDLRSYFKEIGGAETSTPAHVGARNIPQLNSSMLEIDTWFGSPTTTLFAKLPA